MSILFSEIYSKAIALFDDPKVTVAYETNTMQFQKIMYTFLQNAIGQFTNPVSVGIKVSKYIPPKGSMQTFRANGTDKVYRLDDAFEILDNSVYTYIEGDTRVEGKLDKEDRTVEFENILKEGGQYAFEQYYCGEFTEDFSGLNSKTFAGDGLIEQEVKDILARMLVMAWAEGERNELLDIRNLMTDSDFKISNNGIILNSKNKWLDQLQNETLRLKNKLGWNVRFMNGSRNIGRG